MKKTLIAAGLLLAAAILLTPNEFTTTRPPAPTLTHAQRAWLGALEWCESRGRPEALNPKDRDGTPSYGLLQFKPETFAYFADLYGITGTTTDPDAQEAIVTQMILRGGIDWHQQFPACTRALGYPPKAILTLNNP